MFFLHVSTKYIIIPGWPSLNLQVESSELNLDWCPDLKAYIFMIRSRTRKIVVAAEINLVFKSQFWPEI